MIFQEPVICRTPKYVVDTGKLEKPVKVALTNDWHVSKIVSEKQLRFLEKKLKKIKPDVILIQGDLFDTPWSLDNEKLVSALKKEMKLCAEIAETIMIIGNHDQIEPAHPAPKNHKEFESWQRPDTIRDWQKICKEVGVKLLLDDWVEIRGVRIFGFFEDPECFYTKPGARRGENYDAMKEKIRNLSKDGKLKARDGKVQWFVSHAPMSDSLEMEELKDFDVFSFGHTHGGCVPVGIDYVVDLLGVHGGIVAPFLKWFPRKYMRGRELLPNKAHLIINSGMVMTQDSAPKWLHYINFLKAAEITEVIVK